jgi:hypothetical protein
MARRNLRAAIVSAIVGSIAAFATCFVLFFFVFKPGPPVDPKPSSETPSSTPPQEIPNPDIEPKDVQAVTIKTVYKGYFDQGDRCAKSYNEYFGNDDGSFSPNSPCTLRMTFDREGRAIRSIEVQRWNKSAGGMKTVEKTESTSTITTEQFNALIKVIISNEAFKAWRQGTMINVSNCSISVEHAGGTKTVMSNVDEKTTVFLQMVDAFRQLEKQRSWKTAE